MIRDLGLDRPPIDPTTLTAEELTAEIRNLTKGLLGYGARMPKELMLYVKDMLFLDGALAVMAPNVDVLGEIVKVVMYFHERHGERIAREMGVEPGAIPALDVAGIRASLGVDETVDALTYRELQERRELIRRRLEHHQRGRRSAAPATVRPARSRLRTTGVPELRRSGPEFPLGPPSGPMGRHDPPLACNTVWSVTCLAVDVAARHHRGDPHGVSGLDAPDAHLAAVDARAGVDREGPRGAVRALDGERPRAARRVGDVGDRPGALRQRLVAVGALDRELAVDEGATPDARAPEAAGRRSHRAADPGPPKAWGRPGAVVVVDVASEAVTVAALAPGRARGRGGLRQRRGTDRHSRGGAHADRQLQQAGGGAEGCRPAGCWVPRRAVVVQMVSWACRSCRSLSVSSAGGPFSERRYASILCRNCGFRPVAPGQGVVATKKFSTLSPVTLDPLSAEKV